MPASGNQQLLPDRRAYTSPSSMREAISQPTLHRLQPPNGAHPKAMHQCGYQMQPEVMQSEAQKPQQGGSMHYHNLLVSDQDSIRASSNPSQDSGVEMMYYKHPPSTGASADTIEPWMSASQDKEQFEQSLVQPRHRVTSVSAAVQTEGEGGSEKTASPAALNPRVDGM